MLKARFDPFYWFPFPDIADTVIWAKTEKNLNDSGA